MTTRLPDQLVEHLRRVETLVAAGIPAPKEWTALRERFDAYRQMETPQLSRLIDAIVAQARATSAR